MGAPHPPAVRFMTAVKFETKFVNRVTKDRFMDRFSFENGK